MKERNFSKTIDEIIVQDDMVNKVQKESSIDQELETKLGKIKGNTYKLKQISKYVDFISSQKQGS